MPNMQLYICKGIPTDKTYNHVLRFQSDSSRFAYFTSKSVLHLTNYTYQRLEHYLSVGVNAETIEQCNYVVFQNADFSDKWYYAFIDSVEYVANETSRIYFTVDVMQTWFPSVHMMPCFIERSHVNDDTIGSNLVDDNLDCGEYVDELNTMYTYPTYITFLTTFDSDYKDAYGSLDNGIYTGLQVHKFADASSANNFLSGAIEASKSDGIVSVFMSPFAEDSDDVTIKQITSIGKYIPKNNKTLTYPYCYIRIADNSQKLNAVYKQEFFRDESGSLRLPTFMIRGTAGQGSPEIGVIPKYYKLDSDITEHYNYQEAVYAKPFPMCSYNIDLYKAYMAQNASSVAIENANMVLTGVNAVTNVAGASISAANLDVKGTLSGMTSAISDAIDISAILAKRQDLDRLPPQSRGNATSSLGYMLEKRDNLYFYHHHITEEYARMIDNYFSVYGYPIREVKAPNIDCRKNWNYIKTGNCYCTGDIPSESLDTIKSIFNRGVTFWHNPNTVGNYSQDNNIVG